MLCLYIVISENAHSCMFNISSNEQKNLFLIDNDPEADIQTFFVNASYLTRHSE